MTVVNTSESANGTRSSGALASLEAELRAFAPFSEMQDGELGRLLRGSSIVYFGQGQAVLEPGQEAGHCFVVRDGAVIGERPHPGTGTFSAVWPLAEGDMFPLAALIAHRPVSSRYRADRDTFCVAIPVEMFHDLYRSCPVFADFCSRRLGHLLDLSRAQAQADYLSESVTTLGLMTPLEMLVRRSPVRCTTEMSLQAALTEMDRCKVGSMPVVDDEGRPVGIFTQQDVIGRVVLPQSRLSDPMTTVMSSPVHTLRLDATAGDAVMLMAGHGVRHVVVVDRKGRLFGVVSERDLFALQRLSTRQVSTAIRRSGSVEDLVQAASDIRSLAKTLIAQGVAAGQLTRLLASLNDGLTVRLIELTARRHPIGGTEMCWVALGSEGRHEQTIATDQDNGLIFTAGAEPIETLRARLVAFAREVNEDLDRCGYPLCKGGVMASNPRWCSTLDEWRSVFAAWIDRGDPESLLAASIFFDFRSLWGEFSLAEKLRAEVVESARANPRFLKQMADNALRNRPPLGALWGFRTGSGSSGEPTLDLKLNGATPVVDAARIYALGAGSTATNTSDRLRESGATRSTPEVEIQGAVDAFEFIQMMRLRAQLRARDGERGNPNLVYLDEIGEIDRRVLKEAFRQAQRLQTRLQLDYAG